MKIIYQIILTIGLFFVLLFPFRSQENPPIKSTQQIVLTKGWRFREENKIQRFQATVPGVVHTDLRNNKLIPDPWFGTNEKDIQWVETKNWEYETTFEISQNQINNSEINLNFDGLDTYASVYLNDELIGKADNMFVQWKWAVKKQLKVGENKLKVVFYSPITTLKDKVENAPYELPASSEMVDLRVSPYIRKAPYHFGWDWGPRYVTCGIWRPVYLELIDLAKVTDVQVYQKTLTKDSATIKIDTHLHIAKKGVYGLEIGGKYQEIDFQKGDTTIVSILTIKNPLWWWPNGWGEANLYNVNVILRKESQIVDERVRKVGLRTVELVREKDNIGESFYFKVNGKPIFMKGANYIPQSNFLPSVRHSQYDSLIHDVKITNMNMLRVWGGGVYEDDYFYDLCDENGILIWQDFMFAGTMYPFDSAFMANVQNEANYNILRLRNHPSLAFWNGNNEIDVAWKQWGWQKKFKYSTADSTKIYNGYLSLFDTLLRNTVEKLDSGRPYDPSSPNQSFTTLSKGKYGSLHYWGVWHAKQDFVKYRYYIGRFMAEYGFQSFPEMKTIKTFSEEKDWDIDSEVMKWHQKSPIGNGMIALQAEKYFPKATNFEEFVTISQKTQALAMQTAIDAHRLAKDYNGGTLYWQLNDCWPGPSWSSRDVFGRWKLFHERLAVLYSDLAIIPILKNDSELSFYGVNDLLEAKKVFISLRYYDEKDTLIEEKTIEKIIETDRAYFVESELDKKRIDLIRKEKAYYIAEIKVDGKSVFLRKIDRWDVLYF